MSTHILCFRSNIRKIDILLQTPFSLYKWGLRGYLLHGHVILMVLIHGKLFPLRYILHYSLILISSALVVVFSDSQCR